jgi:N-acetylmuramoyl-L-alanine amidase
MNGLHEYGIVLALAHRIASQYTDAVQVVTRPEKPDGLASLIWRLNNEIQPNAVLSLHLNALEGESPNQGYAIYYPGSEVAGYMADAVTENALLNGVHRKQPLVREDLGILRETGMPAVLDEPAYIDRQDHQQALLRRFDGLAMGYVDAVGEILLRDEIGTA